MRTRKSVVAPSRGGVGERDAFGSGTMRELTAFEVNAVSGGGSLLDALRARFPGSAADQLAAFLRSLKP